MAKVIRHTGSFNAFDHDNMPYKINVYTEFIDVSSHDDPKAEAEGFKTFKTESGDNVNRIKKGEYVIVGSGKILSSNDPGAL